MFPVLIILILSFACGSGEKQLLCSSEQSEVWYTCHGQALYHFSISMEPCIHSEMGKFMVSYTLIPVFQLHRIGMKATIWHTDKMILEWVKKDIACTEEYETKFCELIKGESLSDSIYFTTKPYSFPQGPYHATIELFDGDDNQIAACNLTGRQK